MHHMKLCKIAFSPSMQLNQLVIEGERSNLLDLVLSTDEGMVQDLTIIPHWGKAIT